MRIGIFDSGIGGLTVFREIARRFPHLDLLYLGDTARVPYGTKSPETVVRYSFEAAHFLSHRGIELLVVACNTASALALESLQRDLPIQTIGVIHPGARRALQVTSNGRIGVIGTPATIRSDAYAKAIHVAATELNPPSSDPDVRGSSPRKNRAVSPTNVDAPGRRSMAPPGVSPPIQVTSRACPLFVPLAEEGWTENAVALETARIYLEPFRKDDVDTLVLGCTHYPILREAIASVMGPKVTLVDSAEPVAEQVGELSGSAPGTGIRQFFVTDSRERFREVGARFLEEPIEGLEQVSIVGE